MAFMDTADVVHEMSPVADRLPFYQPNGHPWFCGPDMQVHVWTTPLGELGTRYHYHDSVCHLTLAGHDADR
jgi:hypothetical protein